MPGRDNYHVVYGRTRTQFDNYLENAAASLRNAHQKSNAEDGSGYELIYKSDADHGNRISLERGPRIRRWLERQINRLRVRNEVAQLIDAQFGNETVFVKKWRFLPRETIGHRIVRDSATDSGFGVNHIDDAALDRIKRRIDAVHNSIKKFYADPEKRKKPRALPFRFAEEELKILYFRADIGNTTSEEDRETSFGREGVFIWDDEDEARWNARINLPKTDTPFERQDTYISVSREKSEGKPGFDKPESEQE